MPVFPRLGCVGQKWETLFPGAELPAGRDGSFARELTGTGGGVEGGTILQASGPRAALPYNLTGDTPHSASDYKEEHV